MAREVLHAWLMPWAEFTETLDFGSIQIWDFYRDGAQKVTDSQEMLWLAQLMSYFKDKRGGDITRLSVVQHGEPFATQQAEDNYKIRWAGNAICFAYLAGRIIQLLSSDRRFAGVGCSERFQLMGMVIDDEGMLHYRHAGSIGATDLVSKRIAFTEPPQNTDKIDVPDRMLLEGLARVNDSQQDSLLWRQLGTCLEWFSMAWSAAQEVSPPAQFIALMTSFEALVRQGERQGAFDLALAASQLCGWNTLPQVENIQLDRNGLDIRPANKGVSFVFQFSRYRNAFVHGDRLPIGLIRHRVGEHEFFPHEVMSLVIHALVTNLLLQANAWSGAELAIVQRQLDSIIESLHWTTDERIQPSPHENP